MDIKDKILQIILFELLFSNPQKREYSEGVTAVELSRKYKLKIEQVKKNLKILQGKGLVRETGISPKFWIFDEYNFERISEDDPIQRLLCNTEHIDFENYFDYK
ncbi:MAG TPA: hypothetical protein P5556_10810 [Candidatus Gastranaerophilales bacterium]|nr:hypothetical protein [Candidatus Gastranaerophilales bacterium]